MVSSRDLTAFMIGPHANFWSKNSRRRKISVVQKTVPMAGLARLLDSNIF
jgi:hypothetical protein